MSIEKVSFGTMKIQKLRRVALDAHLLETLNLREGDAVQVELDVATATIVMRKAVNAQVKVPRTTSRRRGA
jgi:antitoxin component of MazEF toxin-antitoxin module